MSSVRLILNGLVILQFLESSEKAILGGRTVLVYSASVFSKSLCFACTGKWLLTYSGVSNETKPNEAASVLQIQSRGAQAFRIRFSDNDSLV